MHVCNLQQLVTVAMHVRDTIAFYDSHVPDRTLNTMLHKFLFFV